MKTGYPPHVEAILKAERDRSRDKLDDKIKVMAEVRHYEDAKYICSEFKELVEAVKPEPIRKFLGVWKK